jgi:integrase
MMKTKANKSPNRNAYTFRYEPHHPFSQAVRGLSHFGKKAKKNDLLDIDVIEAYLKKYKPCTQRTYRLGLRLWFLSMAITDVDKLHVIELFNDVRVGRSAKQIDQLKYISIQEMERLAACCSPRMGAVIQILFWGALRITEALNIRIIDCHKGRDNSTVIRVDGKTGPRTITIPTPVFDMVRLTFKGKARLIEQRRGVPCTRQSIYREMIRQTSRAGRRINPHMLRHSRVMDMIERNISIDSIAQFIGHANPSTTAAFYLHSGMPTLRKQGFSRAEASIERIDRARISIKQGRYPWRRYTRPQRRGSFQEDLNRG